MTAVRPKVAELLFQLYGRSLHPELFEVYQSRTVERSRYTAKVQITSAGHLVTWQSEDAIVTEVAAAANHPLPEQRRLLAHRLHGSHSESVVCPGKMNYEVDFRLETIAPELFFAFQQKLTNENVKGLLHSFDASGRVAMGAVSYINIDSREKSLLIQAFHTFPDDSVIVKSQSTFRLES